MASSGYFPTITHWSVWCGLHTVHPVPSNHHSLECSVWVTYSQPRPFQPPLIGEPGVGYIQSTPSLPTTTYWSVWCGLHTVNLVPSNHYLLECLVWVTYSQPSPFKPPFIGVSGVGYIQSTQSFPTTTHWSARCGLHTVNPVPFNHYLLECLVWVTYSPPRLF